MSDNHRRHRVFGCGRSISSQQFFVIFVLWFLGILLEPILSLSQTNFGLGFRDDLLKTTSSKGDTSVSGNVIKDLPIDIRDATISGSSPAIGAKLIPTPAKKGYWCEYCSCGFNKHKSYMEHVVGKRHKAVVAEGDLVWEEYLARKKRDSIFFNSSVTKIEVARAWSLDSFTEGLRARGRSSRKKSVRGKNMVEMMDDSSFSPSFFTGNNNNGGGGNQIDPTLRLDDLPPSKRAALFRYLHVTSSGIPSLLDMVEGLPPKYVRIKELMESMEVLFQFRKLILKRSTVHGNVSKRLTHVYDIGCGHGLVGMLIAASCPHIKVISIDRVPRDSYMAQKHAFRAAQTPLFNLEFVAGDLSVIQEKEKEHGGGHALVLCVHGCNELTHESIAVAREQNWAWLALPCCLRAEDHLEGRAVLKIRSDHTRYAMLCGAIAAKYHPEVIATIDSRITGRGIVLASQGKE